MHTHTRLFSSLVVLSFASCAAHRPFRFPEEGPTPPLIRSNATSSVVVAQVTGAALPESREYSPVVIDENDVAFVSDELRNCDIRAINYQSPNQTAIKELVATDSNEKAPFIIAADAQAFGKCYFVTDSGYTFQVFSGSLPKVRSQTREVLGLQHSNWPHITRDGSKMLYSAIGSKGRYDVCMRDLVTGAESRITEGQRARWNPINNDEFVFTRQDKGVWTICKYSFRTGQPMTLNPSSDDKFDPEYSPDGKLISFTSNERGSSDIWVMRADGSEPRNIDPHGARDCQAVWTPDGLSLLFATDRNGSFDICRLAVPEFVSGATQPAAIPAEGPAR